MTILKYNSNNPWLVPSIKLLALIEGLVRGEEGRLWGGPGGSGIYVECELSCE